MPVVLHMVCGKIGSGKSTLTRRLAAQPMTVLISEDDWLARLYPNEIHAIADYARCAGRLRAAMTGHIEALLTAGMSVVLDFPSTPPACLRSRRAHDHAARRCPVAVQAAGL